MKKLLSLVAAFTLIIAAVPLGAFTIKVDAETEYISNNFKYTVNGGEAKIIGFADDNTVSKIEIPAKLGGYDVTCIEYEAFQNCTSLKSVVIPDSVTSIEEDAFRYCTSLTSVEIGDGVTYIGESAFADCTSLADVIIGDSVTKIDYYAFENCTSLTDVWYKSSKDNSENITIEESNEFLTAATWHYNTCNADEHIYTDENDKTCENYEWSIAMSGDVNDDGSINNRDYALLMQYLNKWDVTINETAADVTGDGLINNRDYALLMQYLNKWDVELQ